MKNVIIGMFCIFALCACKQQQIIDPPSVNNNNSKLITQDVDSIKKQAESIKETNTENTKSASDISDAANRIETNADTAKSLLPVDSPVQKNVDEIKKDAITIENEAAKIKENAAKTQENVKSIEGDAGSIVSNIPDIKKLEKKVTDLEKEKEDLKNGALKSVYSYLALAYGIGFLGIIAGLAISFWVDRKLGFTIAGIGLMTIAGASAAIYYFAAIAMISVIIVIVGILACVGLVVKHLIDQYRANVENVKLVEAIKPKLNPVDKIAVFGAATSVAENLQSDKTIKIVDSIRTAIDVENAKKQ